MSGRTLLKYCVCSCWTQVYSSFLCCSEAKILPGPINCGSLIYTQLRVVMPCLVIISLFWGLSANRSKLVISLHKASCWIFIPVAVGVCARHPGILSEFFFQPMPYRRQLLRVARAPTWDCASDILPEFGLLFPVSFAPASVAPELMQNPQAPQAAPCAMRSATAAKNNYTIHSSSIIPDSPLHWCVCVHTAFSTILYQHWCARKYFFQAGCTLFWAVGCQEV